jgi:hypothetical protein
MTHPLPTFHALTMDSLGLGGVGLGGGTDAGATVGSRRREGDCDVRVVPTSSTGEENIHSPSAMSILHRLARDAEGSGQSTEKDSELSPRLSPLTLPPLTWQTSSKSVRDRMVSWRGGKWLCTCYEVRSKG